MLYGVYLYDDIKLIWVFLIIVCHFCFHDAYIQIDSSNPSSNISVIDDVMKVGELAVAIDTRDEGSGVKSVDLFYQISEGNGKSVVADLHSGMHYAFFVLYGLL